MASYRSGYRISRSLAFKRILNHSPENTNQLSCQKMLAHNGLFKIWNVIVFIMLILAGCSNKGINLRSPSDSKSQDNVPVLGRLNLTSNLPEGGYYDSHVTIGSETDPKFKAYFTLESSKDDGWFIWHLKPDRYVIQTISWHKVQTKGIHKLTSGSDVRLWAKFSVPQNAPSVYIGTLTFNPLSQDRFIRGAKVVDEFSNVPEILSKKLEGLNTEKTLLKWSEPK